MTKIYHPIKERTINVKEISGVKTNATFDKHGKPFDQKYVEFTVIGDNTEYQDFMLLDEFTKHNPMINLN